MEENLKQLANTGVSSIIRIAIFGPESTGKTTLAKQLADYYKTVWVPEFARDYLQEKLDSGRGICDIDDMLPIAYGQTKLENESAINANKYLFCDTNLMVTKVFSELYYNFCDSLLDKAARTHQYDLFFLTDIDVPWEADGLRDSPEGRETIFSVFKQSLIDHKKPYIVLTGNKETRLKTAIFILKELSHAKALGIDSFDFVQIYQRGIPIDKVQQQLEIYNDGIPKTILNRPATINDGIVKLTEQDFLDKAFYFDSHKTNLKLLMLVPASGAATRMFKFLNEFLNEFQPETSTIAEYCTVKSDFELTRFLNEIVKLPFYEIINSSLEKDFVDFKTWSSDQKKYYFIKYLLQHKHFDFANKPKGVLPFHRYKDYVATPFEEHLKEFVKYGAVNHEAFIHFTISESHKALFQTLEKDKKGLIEALSSTSIKIDYSYQSKTTDSITVDTENKLVSHEGKLLFRPGGHGALIQNLNNLDADVFFIKNIDNVIQNHFEENTLYKKALGGILLQLQEQTFSYLKKINEAAISKEEVIEISSFLHKQLNILITKDFYKLSHEDKILEIKNILERPLRVCGMVKNEGEPGGGPFWVLNKKGVVSLQIVESSQVDLKDDKQKQILESATHFNPVDLVCGVKNYLGKQYDLTQFVDTASGFVLERKLGSQVVKSYELPGLWNGAMANWITVFVEVPMITFNPVKNVNDLLKPAHQLENTL